MERRAFIKASMAFAAWCGVPAMSTLFTRSAEAAEANVADGGELPFDFNALKKMAKDLADKPYGGAPP